jgi:NADH-quinone oxidoreductase subunit A
MPWKFCGNHLWVAGDKMDVLSGYVPIFLFMGLTFLFPIVTLLFAQLIRPQTGGIGKLMPYECGVDPDSDARQRYAIRYYVVAILFVIFDVETVFLFPGPYLRNWRLASPRC